jgi:hypothetical protein
VANQRLVEFGIAPRVIFGIDENPVVAYSLAANVDTDLYTLSLPAGALAFDGDSIDFEFSGHFVSSAGDTQISVLFQGNVLYDTGALTATLLGDFLLRGRIMRQAVGSLLSWVELQSSALKAAANDAAFGDASLAGDLVLRANGLTANDVSKAMAVVNFRGVQP